jgi:hypothetical protein
LHSGGRGGINGGVSRVSSVRSWTMALLGGLINITMRELIPPLTDFRKVPGKSVALSSLPCASARLAGPPREKDLAYRGTWEEDPAYRGTWEEDPAYRGTWEEDPAYRGTWEEDPAYRGIWEEDPAYRGTWNRGTLLMISRPALGPPQGCTYRVPGAVC